MQESWRKYNARTAGVIERVSRTSGTLNGGTFEIHRRYFSLPGVGLMFRRLAIRAVRLLNSSRAGAHMVGYCPLLPTRCAATCLQHGECGGGVWKSNVSPNGVSRTYEESRGTRDQAKTQTGTVIVPSMFPGFRESLG